MMTAIGLMLWLALILLFFFSPVLWFVAQETLGW
jgi:hypothetical protein